jgi:hypothetical protein
MTHDPTRDCEHGRLKGKCDVCDLQAEVERLTELLNNPEEHYPGNFDTPQRANALLTGLCQDAAKEIAKLQYEVDAIPAIKEERDALAAEVEQLNKALQWEQNRAERIGTHGPGCHTWGPAHYECLRRVNAELVEALRVARHMVVEDGTPIGWSVDRLSEVISKSTGETT